METLLTVVIPAYNAEKYIKYTLDSLCDECTNKRLVLEKPEISDMEKGETEPDARYQKNGQSCLEVLVVDDGSTDGTGIIIDQYASIDQRIIPIHKENGGETSARIDGIKKASGEYLGFVDGDDYIEPEMFEKLLDNAIKYDADISHCGYQMVFPGRVEYYYNTGRIVQQDKIAGLKDLLSGSFIEPGLWNKLYHKKLFYTLLYENVMPMDIRINEDVLMNYWLFKAADSAVYEDFCPYHYILRKDSAATSILNEHKLKDPVRVMRIIQQDSKDIPEVKEVVEERLTRQLIAISILSVKKQGELIRPFRKEIRNELRTKLILSNSYMSKSVKIRAGWVVLFPDSYCWFHTLYAKITGLDKKYKIE